MAKHGETRERLLRTAAALFRTQGYHATGLNQVIAEGQAPKGSLYFHFPGGKEQLAAESVALSADEIRTGLRAADDLEGALAMFAEHLVASDFRNGCPVATVALDVAADSEQVREACTAAYASWLEVVADFLVRQGIPADRAAGLATTVLAAVEGALLLARTRRDVAPLRQVGADLRVLIEGAR
ncbi:TetR/AcrR family transcriptional regulator [Actinophytocola oryzae]|uniref:TetR family transcriptional regulator n=1 Tax=Actinophytocola oryzae TaxID=502181 RepID=A0A4R7W0R6_9PSEU|nr:TetR/AcrR family transcriptional regulator [Actinophytocola oryzae]TDV55429.1 TetR family transcriptional regulator [Actinophytocola oryzae]